MFLKEGFYAHKGCIYLIKNTVILWIVIIILYLNVKMLFYSCDGKTELLAVQIYSIYLRLVL